ncbi:MAG: XdhC family protein [Cyanobacteria bacterium SZAS LIN-5]|nr:XdhC family protein [Cyanobacteria bacterium SZAS LIN-5]
MSEINDILNLQTRNANRAQKAALATIIKTSGPSYRSAGSRSLIFEDGTYSGGLSAGCLEGDIACRLDNQTSPFIVTYDLSEADDIRGFPFGCGGIVEIFVEPQINADGLEAVYWLSQLVEPAVLLTLVRTESTESEPRTTAKTEKNTSDWLTSDLHDCAGITIGARFGVSKSGTSSFRKGLPELRPLCQSALDERKSRLVQLQLEDRILTIFVEYFEPSINIAIFGDGEDARLLESLANSVGMKVSRLSRQDVRRSEALLNEYPLLVRSYAVIMTHDLTLDAKILKEMLSINSPYLGVMGPRSRTERMLTTIGASAELVCDQARFYAPVGLDMAAETPAEIALSILSEIQTVARSRRPEHLRNAEGPIHDRSKRAGSEVNHCQPESEFGIHV